MTRTDGEVKTERKAKFSKGLLYMDLSVFADPQGRTYISSVLTQDAV